MEGWQSGSIASVLKTEGCKSSVSSNLTPSSHYALVAQRLAQDAYTIEVTGSNPVGSTNSLVAQRQSSALLRRRSGFQNSPGEQNCDGGTEMVS